MWAGHTPKGVDRVPYVPARAGIVFLTNLHFGDTRNTLTHIYRFMKLDRFRPNAELK